MRTIQEKISHWAFLIVILIGAVALAGWLANLLLLAGMVHNFIPMAPGTALSFVLTAAVSLNLLHKKRQAILIKVILFSLLVFNSLILTDSLSGYTMQIEQIFGASHGSYNNLPLGLMSPVTTVLFIISLVSLLIITTDTSKSNKLSMFLSSVGMFAAFTFDLGYWYGTPLLYGHDIIPPALNTALAFTFLFIGILSGFGMNEKPLSLFVGESVRARLMREFLPVTLLIIIIAGWIDAIFIQFFSNHVLVSALVTIFSLFVLSFIILKLAKKIGNDIDHIFAFRKEAEEALRESELHFRTLADSGQALIWTSGMDKKCNYFNQPWLDFTGRNLEQELGDGWIEGVHPDDLNRCFEIYSTAFDHHERFSMDYRLLYRDGNYHWIQDNGTPRFNVRGKFIGYIGHCLDITERKLAETQIAKLNEELEQKVKERTLELEQKNSDLERMNKLFIGRELRMIELKNEIKNLEAKIPNISD